MSSLSNSSAGGSDLTGSISIESMPSNSTSSLNNRLLRKLSQPEFNLLRPHLEFVELPVGHVIGEADTPVEYAYFLDSGIASVVATRADGSRIEAGIIGREGWGNISVLLGADQTPHDIYMQIAGHGHRIKVSELLRAVHISPTLQELLLRYINVFMTQTAQTTLANGTAHIDERLARWLLMCLDRLDGNQIPITHRFLSMMLCVRRSGVTDALHVLEGRGLVKAERGLLTIRDRQKLERLAGASYGVPEAEYRRLLGDF